MQVVILCGGFGTRLHEETVFRPKPMVDIGDRPILWHIMKYYAHFGHHDFILSLGYKGRMIREYFLDYELMENDVSLTLGDSSSLQVHGQHDEKQWQITLAHTGKAALKGARLKRVERHIKDDTFMLTYGDGLASVDIDALLSFHRAHGKLATVTGINPTSRFGELRLDGDRVERFLEKPKKASSLINGGYFIFNRGVLDYLSDDDNCDLEVGPLERVAADGELMAFQHEGEWACMDTDRDRKHLNALWERGQAFWKRW